MYNEGYFYNALKRDIAMVKGDTMSFGFQLSGLEGETPDKVTFSCKSTIEDDYTVFTVSTDDTIDFVSYDAETDTLTYTVRIPPYKTAELELGRYYYDLKAEVNGDIITLMIGRLSIEFSVQGEEAPTPPIYEDGDDDLYPVSNIPTTRKKVYTEYIISNIGAEINNITSDTSTYTTADMVEALSSVALIVVQLNNAIKSKTGSLEDYTLAEMPEAVNDIPTYEDIDDVVFPVTP